MGKKGKKEKGRGAEKSAKKLAKKDQKSEGMEDLEAMIAQFKTLDQEKLTFREEKVCHPSPRSNLTVTAHPDKDELLLFGGEYFNGQKTSVYNDLYVYNIKKNEWSQQFVPNPPPPRCSHQAVAVAKEGGQLWVFGGEFASPTNTQFYHYKDLWVLNLRDHKWEEVKASGGPSQRSGHRMAVYKKFIFLFGGFHERRTNFMYFNDCYLFSLTDYTWAKITPSGTGPTPRSACQLSITPTGILIVGGYSKVKLKKDVEKGTAHKDMFHLICETESKWKWTQIKDSGSKPWPRSGFSLAQMSNNRSVMFGGVCDEEDEEDIDSFFFNSLTCLDLNSYRWFPMELRKSKPLGKKAASGQDEDLAADTSAGTSAKQENEPGSIIILPCARMNAHAAVKHNNLFIYGGIFEQDEKDIALNDLWCIDLKKMETWKQLVESDDTSADWQDVESSEEEDKLSDEDEPSHPSVGKDEDFASYWQRTQEHWLARASDNAAEDERADSVRNTAEKTASSWFKTSVE